MVYPQMISRFGDLLRWPDLHWITSIGLVTIAFVSQLLHWRSRTFLPPLPHCLGTNRRICNPVWDQVAGSGWEFQTTLSLKKPWGFGRVVFFCFDFHFFSYRCLSYSCPILFIFLHHTQPNLAFLCKLFRETHLHLPFFERICSSFPLFCSSSAELPTTQNFQIRTSSDQPVFEKG